MLKYVIDVTDHLDDPAADGPSLVTYLRGLCPAAGTVADEASPQVPTISTETVHGAQGHTDFVRVTVPGTHGKLSGGTAPTLGIVGRLGGVGARPELLGMTSDGDGAVAALSAAAKLLSMFSRGDRLDGDVMVATHVCPDAPTLPHEPVPFMDSPVDIGTMNDNEVDPAMDAVLSVDTTKGNTLISHRGVALSPTVREGFILKVSDDLADLLAIVSGEPVVTFPVTMQDITPYGNGVHHINSILQPATATAAPVVGLAITTVTAVPGCATGASTEADIALAARFAVEAAKSFGSGRASFSDDAEFSRMKELYGSMAHLQTPGQTPEQVG